jgi:murein L,D-transpeptidase YcbB/YkuD
VLEYDLSRGNVRRAALAAQVAKLAAQQQAADATLESLSPPPRLRAEYAQAVTVFLVRTNGLRGLVTGLRNTRTSAASLSSQGKRLVASDVLWQTFVQAATLAELRSEGVKGLDPPGSRFLSSWDVVSPEVIAHDLAATPGAAAGALSGSATLKLGDRGPAVATWQVALEQWLKQSSQAVTVATNGTFDQATESATVSFQGTVGITPDGVVGPVTKSAMQRAIGP